ncbi:MFS transporter [Acinetobacter baumannii]|uniref:MFS transporter n=1 Tax=Acinetobacter baumannii TaxID=470 RepID=UPI000E698ECB|nr:MFS transporter [Acinetobacter baumannii]RIW61080.1 MFS transporter [Acinetobacter baumannii]
MKSSSIELLAPSEIIDKSIQKKAWVITGLLIIFQMINFADKAVLGLVAEPAMQELSLSGSQFGFIGSAFFFLFAISAILVGFIAMRVQTRWLIFFMGVAWAVLMFPMLWGGAALLLISRILLGAAEGPATPITLQHVHGWYEPKERGLPSSLVAIGSTLGPIIAAPILAWIIAHPNYGWRWAFGFLGIIGLIWTSLWFFVAKEGPYSHIRSEKELSRPLTKRLDANNKQSIVDLCDDLTPIPMAKIFFSPMFIVAFLAGAGCFWAMGFLTTWAPRYLSAVVNVTPESLGVLVTLPWICGALVLFLAGVLSRKLMAQGRSVHVSLGVLLGIILITSGVLFQILPFLNGETAVAVLIFAAGFAMTFPLVPTAVAYSVCSKQRAVVMATLTALASCGGMVSPIMVGILMDTAGYIQPKKSEPLLPEMMNHLLTGMNIGFRYIGLYLLIIGIAAVIFLNPDKTAKSLQNLINIKS